MNEETLQFLLNHQCPSDKMPDGSRVVFDFGLHCDGTVRITAIIVEGKWHVQQYELL